MASLPTNEEKMINAFLIYYVIVFFIFLLIWESGIDELKQAFDNKVPVYDKSIWMIMSMVTLLIMPIILPFLIIEDILKGKKDV
jgi:hypothetical protein